VSQLCYGIVMLIAVIDSVDLYTTSGVSDLRDLLEIRLFLKFVSLNIERKATNSELIKVCVDIFHTK
jgi:hypothetical protein